MVYLELDSLLMSEQIFFGFAVFYKKYFMFYLVLDSDLMSEQVFYGLDFDLVSPSILWFIVLDCYLI